MSFGIDKLNRLSDTELKIISKIVEDTIFIPQSQKTDAIFLCGADIRNNNTARHKMAKLFSKNKRYELHYPEDLFDDLLVGQGQYNLLYLENILAKSVDAIILFPESPGSFSELGAFSNNNELAKKMIVIADKRYEKNKSFINFGPNKLIRKSKTGKVIHFNYELLNNDEKVKGLHRKINSYLAKIKKAHPVKKGAANLLEAENFILPCIYLFDEINRSTLYRLVEKITSQDPALNTIATRSSLSRLITKRLIIRSPNGYEITKDGANHVRRIFKSSSLDAARVEFLNLMYRRNSSVNYGRVKKGAGL